MDKKKKKKKKEKEKEKEKEKRGRPTAGLGRKVVIQKFYRYYNNQMVLD